MSDSESDSESSSSSEEQQKTQVVVKKQPVKEDSDSDDSDSSDSEEEAPKAKPVAKKEAESDSDSDSSDSEEEEAPAAKSTPAPVAAKEEESDSDSDSDSDDEEEKKPTATKASAAKDDSDSDSESSDDEEEEKKVEKMEVEAESSDDSDSDKAKKPVAEPVAEAPEKMEVEEEKIDFTKSLSKTITATPLFVWDMSKGINKGKKRKLDDSSSPQAAKKAKAEESSTSTTTETSSPSTSTDKTPTDMTPVKEFNAYDYKNSHLKGETSTVFIKGIDINAFEADIKAFMSDIEEPVAIRHKWQEDRPGIAFIQFSSPAVATKVVIDKNNEYIKDRYINTDWSEERKKSVGSGGSFGRGPKNIHLKDTTNRVWLGNLHREVYEDSIREMVKEVGILTDVYIIGRDESRPKIAYISFESNELATKAVETCQGASLMDYNVRFDWAEPRKDGGSARAAKPLSEKPEGCMTVFVGRLADSVDDEKLQELFKDAGEITQIRYMERDGEFRGVAFIEFGESDSTDKAVEKNGSSFLGRSIRVDYSASKKREPRW